MKTTIEPINGSNLDPALLEVIEPLSDSPELQQLLIDYSVDIDQAHQQIDNISGIIEKSEAPQAIVFDQSVVDKWTDELSGDVDPSLIASFSKDFVELSRVRKNSPTGMNHLTSGALDISLNYAETRKSARLMGTHVTKTKQLIEFWENSNFSINQEQISEVMDSVFDPVAGPLNLSLDLTSRAKHDLGRVSEVLEHFRAVDPEVNLSKLKFVIFSALVGVMKDKEIVKAYVQISGKNSDLMSRPDGIYYVAGELLKSLEDTKSQDWKSDLQNSYYGHVGSRLFQVPSRKFKSPYEQMKKLAVLYRNICNAEDYLSEHTQKQDGLESVQEAIAKRMLSNIAVAVYKGSKDVDHAMVAITNEEINSGQTASENELTWQRAKYFDEVRAFAGKSILDHIKAIGINLDSRIEDGLIATSETGIGSQIEEIETKNQLAQLKPEVDSRISKFESIDNNYALTNKKIRERSDSAITLAKVLGDSLNEQSKIDDSSARAVVSLMQGLYWERTGREATDAELAQIYLTDAFELRQLSTELQFLGQPMESKLLKIVNLLDELIDTGIFDEIQKHPELKVFEYFILEYLTAMDKIDTFGNIIETEDEPIVLEEDEYVPIPTQIVPVEIIGQAISEDIKVFPPGSTQREIEQDYKEQIGSEDNYVVEWERIKRIVELRDQFTKQGLEVQFIRTQHASWQVLPFFVLDVKLPYAEHSVAVVESPVYGNATYIYREASDRLSWRDVVQLSRAEARELGAIPTVHVDSQKLQKHFVKVWNRVISELTIFQ